MDQAVQDSSAESNDVESCKLLQLKAYVNVDPRYRVPVMVSIMAPPSGLTAEQREPVDLVVVLHVRDGCKVPEKWKELLVQAVEVIVEKLGDKDSLAVVPGQSTLQPMSDANKKKASDAAKVVIRSGTSVLRYAETAESILYDRRYEDKDRRAGYIIVISNSNDDIESLLTWSFRLVHAFGFRDSRNARAMHSIASSRDCTYAILDDEYGRVTGALAASIDRITSAMPIEVILKCEQQVELPSAMDAPRISYFISQDRKVGMLWGSAHLGGAATNFVINMQNLNVRHDQREDLAKLISVQAKYGHVWDKLDGQVVAVEKGNDGSKEVAAEIVRIRAFKIVGKIIADDKKDLKELHAAAEKLHQGWTDLNDSDCGKEASEAGLISGLTAEMQEMEIRLWNNYLWLEYMLSWQSYQRWQLPLPHLFMEKQVTDDSLLQLRIFSKVSINATPIPGTTTQRKQGHTVLLRLMAPEASLAMAKCPSVDLITILDVEKETLELQLLIKAMEKMKTDMEKMITDMEKMETERADMKKMKSCMEMKTERADMKKMKTDMEKMKTDMEKMETDMEKMETERADMKKMKTDMEKMKTEMEKMKTEMEKMEMEKMKMEKMKTEMEKMKTEMEKMKTERADLEKKIQKKRELLIKAMDVLMEKLSNKDRLAIISIQSSVDETAAGLLEMCNQKRSETSTMVRKLLATSSNDTVSQPQVSHRRDKIKKAMKLVRKCLQTSPVNSPIPTPTSPKSQRTASTRSDSVAIASSTNLWKALTDATKILDDRQGEEKDRVGFIIVISDRNGQSMGEESLSSNYITHAFGFVDNDTDNTRVMHRIASSSNGIYAILNDDRDQISEPFTECIKKITTVVAVQAKLDIKCSHSSTATLSTVGLGSGQEKVDMIDGDGKNSAGSIFAGVFSAGTVKNFMVYVDNVDHDHNNVSKLLGVHVKWLRAPTSREEEEGKLDSQVAINGSEEVVATIIARIEAAKIIRNIIDPDFDRKLLADMAARDEAIKIIRERLELKITRERLEQKIIHGFEITEPEPIYDAKLVAVMLEKMCHQGWENALAAGEARLASEMKKMEDSLSKESKQMKDSLEEIKKLVEDRLPYMLSWLSFQMLSEKPPALP